MNLNEFFQQHPKIALGFSGGVDSSYLFYAAVKARADIRAYYVHGPFQAEFEYDDAKHLAEEIGAEDRLTVIEADVLSHKEVTDNPWNRCYYCKTLVFGTISERAGEDGYTTIIDGTNASDDPSDRPGVRALQEMQVLSPLQLCGMTKEDIRKASKAAGLFTWNKPSNACLATRIPTGEEITQEKLDAVEYAEDALRRLGFSDLRVRKRGETGLIQLPAEQFPQAVEKRAEIQMTLHPYFPQLALDLQDRKSR